MKHNRLFLIMVVLVFASLACSLLGGGSSKSGVGDSPSAVEGESGGQAAEFPMPPKVENFTDLGDNSINYQTSMKLTEVVDFYRDQFGKAGYVERPILTVINEDTFSMVWDGHPSGKAIVVQGVDLGDGSVNVNIRLEDV